MRPFTIVTGQAAPLLAANIDTDVIIRIERLTEADQSRLGEYALEALRFLPGGEEDPDFVLNLPRFRDAPILLAGPNFGCGSSREGAVTALAARGFRAIIAPSFGDIFFANCFQNGVLPIRLDEAAITSIGAEVTASDAPVTIDLEQCSIRTPAGRLLSFEVDHRRREGLLNGLDDIGLTNLQRDDVVEWQRVDRKDRPWVWDVGAQHLSEVID